jgi:hypothetical protein
MVAASVHSKGRKPHLVAPPSNWRERFRVDPWSLPLDAGGRQSDSQIPPFAPTSCRKVMVNSKGGWTRASKETCSSRAS